MLRELSVQNLALIEDARVELREGFCAWTGETGAGKSLLLTALGLVLGAVALCMVAIIWGDAGVGLAVGLAIVAASSIATVVALALPWVFHRFGSDPAFGSGPLATVIQDVLSVTIYFAIAAQVAV